MNQGLLHILIADDDIGDRKLIKRLLKQSGLMCECVEAESVEEALVACSTKPFDCIIIDYRLPGQDGLAGIDTLHNQFPTVAIIMTTGQGDEMVATEALKLGASDYIVKKNLNPELLKKSISAAIEKLQLQKLVKEHETKIQYIAYHDYLTGTPNRLLFADTLKRTLAGAKRNKKMFAVIMLDLDHFKNINDTLGHEEGDSLLRQATQRFQSVLREEDMLARLGGDEFAVLISEMKQNEEADRCATRILDSLKESFILANKTIGITASIGIAIYPLAGENTSDLMRNADKAMYQAKNAGRNTIRSFEDTTR